MNIRVPDNLADFILTVGFYAAMQAVAEVDRHNDEVRKKPNSKPTLREVK